MASTVSRSERAQELTEIGLELEGEQDYRGALAAYRGARALLPDSEMLAKRIETIQAFLEEERAAAEREASEAAPPDEGEGEEAAFGDIGSAAERPPGHRADEDRPAEREPRPPADEERPPAEGAARSPVKRELDEVELDEAELALERMSLRAEKPSAAKLAELSGGALRAAVNRQVRTLLSSQLLDMINTSDEEELVTLRGIGPKRAAHILNERKTRGAFETLDDLTRIGVPSAVAATIVEDNLAAFVRGA